MELGQERPAGRGSSHDRGEDKHPYEAALKWARPRESLSVEAAVRLAEKMGLTYETTLKWAERKYGTGRTRRPRTGAKKPRQGGKVP
ncbi:hypothetical protein GCM10009416_25360 [Craurococcus roseus]|uniref:Transposase n=1 Tax=Craurococcus roseus TaxID=77585 RepID=A0ABP3QEW9_9PROT